MKLGIIMGTGEMQMIPELFHANIPVNPSLKHKGKGGFPKEGGGDVSPRTYVRLQSKLR